MIKLYQKHYNKINYIIVIPKCYNHKKKSYRVEIPCIKYKVVKQVQKIDVIFVKIQLPVVLSSPCAHQTVKQYMRSILNL